MTGEVLRAARHRTGFQPFRESDAEARDAGGVPAEGAIRDHRIVGIRVDVEHRRVVVIDAAGGELLRDEPAELFRDGHAVHPGHAAGRVDLSHPPHAGELRPVGSAEPLYASAFLVDGDEKRRLRCCLQRPRQLRHLLRTLDVAAEEHHPADTAADELELVGGGCEPLDPDDHGARGERIEVQFQTSSVAASPTTNPPGSRCCGTAQGASTGANLLGWPWRSSPVGPGVQ